MSLVTTTIYTPPVFTPLFFDYIGGTLYGAQAQNQFVLPDFFNRHTIWLAHWLFPAGLLLSGTILKQIQGLQITFMSDQSGIDYTIQYMRPPSSANAAGTLVAAGLNGPSFVTQNTIAAKYNYGIGGGAQGLANVLATFANDPSMTIPLGNVSSQVNFVDHFTPDAMVACALGGSNTSPATVVVSNMAICNASKVKFTANKIGVTVPDITSIMTPTNGQPYWAYGMALIRSEQI